MKIAGVSLPRDQLVIESSSIELSRVQNLLAGQIGAYVVRSCVDSSTCETMTRRFMESSAKKPRIGVFGEVEGYFIGASHIDKSTADYLDECEEFRAAEEEIARDLLTGLDVAKGILTDFGYRCRPAEALGRPAGTMKMVAWNGAGKFLLLPHDDVAQLTDARQVGFEIQEVKQVVALNCYLRMPDCGGGLRVWNIAPTIAAKDELGLGESGYPYPLDALSHIESILIQPNAGDIVLLNGNLVHAVDGVEANLGDRLLLTCFMGCTVNGDVIWWT